MAQFDYIVIAIVIVSVLLGWWRGLVYEVLSLLSWGTSYWVAKTIAVDLTPYMPDVLEGESLRSAAAFSAVFTATLILCGIASWSLSKLIKSFGMDSHTDGATGAFFGLLRGWFLVLLLVLLAGLTQLPQSGFWRDALMSKSLQNVALLGRELLPDDMAKRIKY